MKLTVQTISQPAQGEVDLTLHFSGIEPTLAAKVASLGQVIQQAAADGRFSVTEDLMIGLALGAVFSR